MAAALLSLHDLGFSYNDLKPENILITELGHVKVGAYLTCSSMPYPLLFYIMPYNPLFDTLLPALLFSSMP